jgi:PGF-pre-PGF domain-containing protein
VTNEDSNTVSVIDTATNTVKATVEVGSDPKGIAITPDGTNVYVTNYDSNTVSVIGTATNKVTDTIEVGKSPWAVAVSPDGTKVYVTNDVCSTVSVIDTSTNVVTTLVDLKYQNPSGVAISPDGTNVYVSSGSSNNVSIISTASNEVTNTIIVGSVPHGVAVSPDGKNVYVANTNSKTVSVISTAANEVIATVTAGNGPYAVAVSPDGTKVYVPDRDDNTVSVIDTATNTVTTTVNVGKQPKALGQFIGDIPVKLSIPVADFSASQTSGNQPLSVSFYDISTGSPNSWYWDFGDEATSAERSPSHTYTDAGNYIVNLTVYNENGTDSKTQKIIVNKSQSNDNVLPIADFSSNLASGNAPLSIQFTDLSQDAIRWLWDFGDGSGISNEQNPTHTYSVAGTYSVSLTVINQNGTSSKLNTITVLEGSSPSDGGGGGSNGGSGGGGGAGGSPESQSNVESKEISQMYITSGNSVKFDFPQKATPVVDLSFDSKKTAGKTTTIAEVLKGESTLVSGLPSGKVYKYLNIWVGDSGFATPSNIENALVSFKVEKSWIEDQKIDKSLITLNRYIDNTWNPLPTNLSSEDDNYRLYQNHFDFYNWVVPHLNISFILRRTN